MSEIVTATLVLQVTATLNGAPPKALEENLQRLVFRAASEGLLTGETPMETEEYSFHVILSDVYVTPDTPEPPDEDNLDGIEDSVPDEDEVELDGPLTTGDGTQLRHCTRCGEVVPKNTPCGCPVDADSEYSGDEDDDEIPY